MFQKFEKICRVSTLIIRLENFTKSLHIDALGMFSELKRIDALHKECSESFISILRLMMFTIFPRTLEYLSVKFQGSMLLQSNESKFKSFLFNI